MPGGRLRLLQRQLQIRGLEPIWNGIPKDPKFARLAVFNLIPYQAPNVRHHLLGGRGDLFPVRMLNHPEGKCGTDVRYSIVLHESSLPLRSPASHCLPVYVRLD